MNLTRRELAKLMAGASAAGIAGASARAASRPIEDMPQNACDCHVHIAGPAAKYPMDPNRTYTAGEASTDDLRVLRKRLGIGRTCSCRSASMEPTIAVCSMRLPGLATPPEALLWLRPISPRPSFSASTGPA
jgi:hypothetical protein